MTGNVLIDLAIAAVGVAILVGIAWAVFGGRPAPLDIERAAARLLFDEPDFEPQEWLINDERNAALAHNGRGEAALLLAHGDGIVTRRFAVGALNIQYTDGRLIIDPHDHTCRRASFSIAPEAVKMWL